MLQRLGIVAFFIVIVAGFWFQRRFMRISSEEFQAELTADRSQATLMRMNQFVAYHYADGALRTTMKASEAKLLKNGDLLLDGNVKYQDYDETGMLFASMSSAKAICKLEVSNPNQNFFDSTRQLETAFLPDDVLIVIQDDLINTKDVTLNMRSRLLETRSAVSVVGPGRTLEGTGLTYNLETERFDIGGPVVGKYIPRQTQ